MGVTGVVVGSLMGLTTKLGSNVLQKVPYMRRTSPDAYCLHTLDYVGLVVRVLMDMCVAILCFYARME